MKHPFGYFSVYPRANCNKIWEKCLWLRPPSLWLTINPMDYEDPIAQIWAGKWINMDSFMSLLGPNANERAINIAQDLYNSASFFNFTIWTTLEMLFGICTSPQQIKTHMGILGFVNGYFGVIKAQGRGSLHVHMLLWLKHTLNANEMLDLLTWPDLCKKIAEYVDFNIHTHLDDFNNEYVSQIKPIKHSSHLRPPNPHGNQWKTEVREMKQHLARVHQVHVCKMSTCLCRNSHGDLVFKWQAPWP
jgi:hypothetical protein